MFIMKVATKNSIIAHRGRTKPRTLNRPRSSRGRRERRSWRRNPPADTTNTAPVAAAVPGLIRSREISEKRTMNETSAAARPRAPSQSMWNPGSRFSRRRRNRRAKTSNTPPMGRLIRKIVRQPRVSTRNPPRIGPRMLPTATVEPRYPMARPRSWGGKVRNRIAPLMLKTIAAPTACTTRKAMSWARDRASPQAREARVKTPSPRVNRFVFPVNSDSLPKNRSRAVRVTM
jgi:hypothetical protein